MDQANRRANNAKADANTAIEQAQYQAAELRGRAEQLEAENGRLTKLINDQLRKIADD